MMFAMDKNKLVVMVIVACVVALAVFLSFVLIDLNVRIGMQG